MLYAIFQSIGVDIESRPILQLGTVGEDYYDYQGEIESEKHRAYLRYGTMFEPEYSEPRIVDTDERDIDRRWKRLLLLRQPLGFDQTWEFLRRNGCVAEEPEIPNGLDRVGNRFHPYVTTDRGGEVEEAQDVSTSRQLPGYSALQ